MKYTLNKQQYSELEGLAYHIADLNYMRECGENNAELELKRKTISFAFNQLDKSGVPFWVQNTVICWAEEWRNHLNEYLWQALARRGVVRA